jgi:hypothetical protein
MSSTRAMQTRLTTHLTREDSMIQTSNPTDLMRHAGTWGFALLCAFQVGCSSNDSPACRLDAGCGATRSEPEAGSKKGPAPFVLVPGKPGEALPPMNKAVADRWPTLIQSGINAILALQRLSKGKVPPDNEMIEKSLQVKITTDVTTHANTGSTVYRVDGWLEAFQDSENSPSGKLSRYHRESSLGDYAYIQLNLSPRKYCLDPYELAVYLGGTYRALPLPPSPHTNMPLEPRYKPAYTWGMFDRGISKRHIGSKGLLFEVANRCVLSISIGLP